LCVGGDQAPAARAALDRVRLWWFTVPAPGRSDKVLDIRKIDVGRPAIGNTGPIFAAADADRLLRERRLVIDMGHVPTAHWFLSYYRKRRVADLAAAINRLEPVPLPLPVAQAVAGERETLAPAPEPAAGPPAPNA